MAINKNKKQELIHNTAKELFWKHGFKRVSVEEICKFAHVSKMTFYKFFPNKIELAKTVYSTIINTSITEFHNIITEDSTTEDKIQKFLQLKLKGTNHISKEFLSDFYSDTELGLKEYIEGRTKEVYELIIADFEFAQEKGWFRKDINPRLIFAVSQKLTELVNNGDLLKLYESPQALIMALTNFFVYGITNRA